MHERIPDNRRGGIELIIHTKNRGHGFSFLLRDPWTVTWRLELNLNDGTIPSMGTDTDEHQTSCPCSVCGACFTIGHFEDVPQWR